MPPSTVSTIDNSKSMVSNVIVHDALRTMLCNAKNCVYTLPSILVLPDVYYCGNIKSATTVIYEERKLYGIKLFNSRLKVICAVQEGHTEILKELIEAGADVSAKDNDDMTALLYATQEGQIDIVNLLRVAGAR